MPPSLLTAAQARWALDILVILLSAIAIASSAPPSAGGEVMYSGTPGDIRGLIVIMGSTGLIGVGVIRIFNLLIPKVWRVYLDRLEFTLVAMLWICWTSATMAFSAFTLNQGICSFSSTLPEFMLPTCPLLTFDLTLLHLLSTATLALLLVILSAVLSTNYLSALDDSSAEDVGSSGKSRKGDAFVMWELALASAPSSPLLTPTTAQGSIPSFSARSYGTSSPTTPLTSSIYPQFRAEASTAVAHNATAEHATLQVSDENQDLSQASRVGPSVPAPPKKRDKFAEGRLRTYIPLALCSFGAAGASMAALSVGEFAYSGIFLFVIAVYSLFFSIACIGVHFSQKHSKGSDSERQSPLLRKERALEVGAAGVLFLLWPLAAVLYTLFPTTPNRPCANLAASAVPSPGEDIDQEHAEVLCSLSWTVVTLSWLASWVVLTRVMGLVFPMPEVEKLAFDSTPRLGPEGFEGLAAETSEEGRSLLRSERGRGRTPVRLPQSQSEFTPPRPSGRPQVGWGRIVAGEAFELGDDADDEDESDDDRRIQ